MKIKKSVSTLKQKTIKLYNRPLLIKIKNTLVFNTLRVFLLVLCLLLIIFSCSPKSAHLTYSSSDIDNIYDITFDSIKMSLQTNMCSVHNFEQISMDISNFDSIEIDGVNYNYKDINNSYSLIITKNSDAFDGFINFVNSDGGTTNNFDCFISSKFERYSKFDKAPLSINDINTDSFEIINQIGFDITFYTSIDILFDDCNIKLVDDEKIMKEFSNSRIKIHKPEIESSNLKLFIDGYSVFDIIQLNNGLVSSKADIIVAGIKEIKCLSSGQLSFSYTLTPNSYELYNQELILQSNNYELNASMKFDKFIKEFKIDGIAHQAHLSGLNLFPSFSGWYRDNVYLAPLTLVTTILGAVSLTNKNKK